MKASMAAAPPNKPKKITVRAPNPRTRLHMTAKGDDAGRLGIQAFGFKIGMGGVGYRKRLVTHEHLPSLPAAPLQLVPIIAATVIAMTAVAAHPNRRNRGADHELPHHVPTRGQEHHDCHDGYRYDAVDLGAPHERPHRVETGEVEQHPADGCHADDAVKAARFLPSLRSMPDCQSKLSATA